MNDVNKALSINRVGGMMPPDPGVCGRSEAGDGQAAPWTARRHTKA